MKTPDLICDVCRGAMLVEVGDTVHGVILHYPDDDKIEIVANLCGVCAKGEPSIVELELKGFETVDPDK